MIKHNCKQAKLKIQSYLILAFVLFTLIGCVNQSGQIPEQAEIQTPGTITFTPDELNKLYEYWLNEETSNAIEEQGGTTDQMAIIALNITGTELEDPESLDFIRDAFRDEIFKSSPQRFKILDSTEIESELQLSAKVSQVTTYNSDRSKCDVRMTIRGIKLTDLYSTQWSPSIRASFISAPSINTHQSASNKRRAIELATKEAMLKLKKRKFFKQIRRHKIVKAYMKKSTTFVFNDKKELEKLLERMLSRIMELSISDIKSYIAKSHTFSNLKHKVAIQELLNQIPKKEVVIKTNNHSPQNIQAQKKFRGVFKHEKVQKIIEGEYTCVIIRIKSGDFTYNSTTKVVNEENKNFPLQVFGKINYLSKLPDEGRDKWGKKTLTIYGIGHGNDLLLEQHDFYKLNNIRISNKVILDYPGIFVIHKLDSKT